MSMKGFALLVSMSLLTGCETSEELFDAGDGGGADGDAEGDGGESTGPTCYLVSETTENEAWSYTYDDNGNLLSAEMSSDIEAPMSLTYTYDDEGNRLTRDREGSTDSIYTYDDSGRLLTTELFDAEGNLIVRVAYTYAEDALSRCNIAGMAQAPCFSVRQSFGPEGNADQRTTYTYDEQGNMLTQEQSGVDGVVDEWWIYTYDDHGNALSFEHETSSFLELYTYTYTYDDEGNVLTREESSPDLGARWTYTYEVVGDGRRCVEGVGAPLRGGAEIPCWSVMERDDDADGIVDERTTHTYDCRD